MHSKPAVVLLSTIALVSAFNARSTVKNTVQDAHEQLTRAIRCWEQVDSNNPSAGYTMSEPIYELCSYMPDQKEYTKFYVNGINPDSDDYNNIFAMFRDPIPGHAVLNVCLQEAFQFHTGNHPSQVSLRCLCKRDGCNLPKEFSTFLEFNTLPIPEVYF